MINKYQQPRWVRDLSRFLPLKSQFILTGNVRDLQIRSVGSYTAAAPLIDVLAAGLNDAGFEDIVRYDPINGVEVMPRSDGSTTNSDDCLARLGINPSNRQSAISPDLLSAILERHAYSEGPATALIIDFASRLTVRVDALSNTEHQLFTRAFILSQLAQSRPVGLNRGPLFNCIIWIVEKEGDLPDWLTIDNPHIRHIPLAPPDRDARRAVASSLIRGLPGAKDVDHDLLSKAENSLVDSTEGLLLVDLNAITQLARAENVQFANISEAVRRYKIGVTEDAWQKIERAKIKAGLGTISRRVVGQDHAVIHMLDIVKRAATGIGGGGSAGRPRGIAFLAGPTGVGKTELAKSVTELLFGDESAYIRFDMSEFSAEHADQRLIGAPPGYVGYDVGGELTNAVRERPFSVVLFDEIEKAHPRILDKFLQILDDGVLTSGRGDRVYFSEALIIFTSNLGIYSTTADGGRKANVSTEQPFEEVRQRVRAEIENHFKLVLNRPEILNRFGENIIVFDFIRPSIAEKIFDGMVDAVLKNALASGYKVNIAPKAMADLRKHCVLDLSNGGRGIRNKIEAHLINPLARTVFEHAEMRDFFVTDINVDATTELIVEVK